MTASLGRFEIQCSPTGKVSRLSVVGMSPFLHEGAFRGEVAGGVVIEVCGWDECFPTIDAYGTSPVMGDLFREAPCLRMDGAEVSMQWVLPRYRATRRLRALSPGRLESSFSVTSTGEKPLPFLWASHALFCLSGLRRVRFADGTVLDRFRLDGSSRKCFKANGGPIRLEREDSELSLESDQGWWGVWLNRGGWPAGRPVGYGCLGIEATNHAADVPGDAFIMAGASFTGYVQLEVHE